MTRFVSDNTTVKREPEKHLTIGSVSPFLAPERVHENCFSGGKEYTVERPNGGVCIVEITPDKRLTKTALQYCDDLYLRVTRSTSEYSEVNLPFKVAILKDRQEGVTLILSDVDEGPYELHMMKTSRSQFVSAYINSGYESAKDHIVGVKDVLHVPRTFEDGDRVFDYVRSPISHMVLPHEHVYVFERRSGLRVDRPAKVTMPDSGYLQITPAVMDKHSCARHKGDVNIETTVLITSVELTQSDVKAVCGTYVELWQHIKPIYDPKDYETGTTINVDSGKLVLQGGVLSEEDKQMNAFKFQKPIVLKESQLMDEGYTIDRTHGGTIYLEIVKDKSPTTANARGVAGKVRVRAITPEGNMALVSTSAVAGRHGGPLITLGVGVKCTIELRMLPKNNGSISGFLPLMKQAAAYESVQHIPREVNGCRVFEFIRTSVTFERAKHESVYVFTKEIDKQLEEKLSIITDTAGVCTVLPARYRPGVCVKHSTDNGMEATVLVTPKPLSDKAVRSFMTMNSMAHVEERVVLDVVEEKVEVVKEGDVDVVPEQQDLIVEEPAIEETPVIETPVIETEEKAMSIKTTKPAANISDSTILKLDRAGYRPDLFPTAGMAYTINVTESRPQSITVGRGPVMIVKSEDVPLELIPVSKDTTQINMQKMSTGAMMFWCGHGSADIVFSTEMHYAELSEKGYKEAEISSPTEYTAMMLKLDRGNADVRYLSGAVVADNRHAKTKALLNASRDVGKSVIAFDLLPGAVKVVAARIGNTEYMASRLDDDAIGTVFTAVQKPEDLYKVLIDLDDQGWFNLSPMIFGSDFPLPVMMLRQPKVGFKRPGEVGVSEPTLFIGECYTQKEVCKYMQLLLPRDEKPSVGPEMIESVLKQVNDHLAHVANDARIALEGIANQIEESGIIVQSAMEDEFPVDGKPEKKPEPKVEEVQVSNDNIAVGVRRLSL